LAVAKISDLKIYLNSLDEKTLKEEIIELFKLYPAVKEYFSLKICPDHENELLDKYKKVVKNEFFPDRGFGKLRYSVMKKAVSDFKKIAKLPVNIAELMVFYVENGVAFTNTFGDIDKRFYNNILDMYESALEYIVAKNLQKSYQTRLKGIVEEGNGIGWGFSDALTDLYYSFFDDFDKI